MEYKQLFEAFAKAQAEMPVVKENNENPFYKSKYADYTDIVKSTRPHLIKHGLSILQPIVTINDKMLLRTMLCHVSGEYIVSEVEINPPKTDVQSIGSYITYMRRYSYVSMIGACVGDDDDGNKAVAASKSAPSYSAVRSDIPPHDAFNQGITIPKKANVYTK